MGEEPTEPIKTVKSFDLLAKIALSHIDYTRYPFTETFKFNKDLSCIPSQERYKRMWTRLSAL